MSNLHENKIYINYFNALNSIHLYKTRSKLVQSLKITAVFPF